MAGVDLVARIHAEVYLHDDFVFCNNIGELEDFTMVFVLVVIKQI